MYIITLEIESLSLLNVQRGGGGSRESSFCTGKAIPSYFAVQRRSNAPNFCHFQKKSRYIVKPFFTLN